MQPLKTEYQRAMVRTALATSNTRSPKRLYYNQMPPPNNVEGRDISQLPLGALIESCTLKEDTDGEWVISIRIPLFPIPGVGLNGKFSRIPVWPYLVLKGHWMPDISGREIVEAINKFMARHQKSEGRETLIVGAEAKKFPYTLWGSLAVLLIGGGIGYVLFADQVIDGTANYARVSVYAAFFLLLASSLLRAITAMIYKGAALVIGTLVIFVLAANTMAPQLFPTIFRTSSSATTPANNAKGEIPSGKAKAVPTR